MHRCIAIIQFWNGSELLPYAVRQWKKCGIEVMIVYSNTSNYRQITNNTAFLTQPEFKDCMIVKCEPLESLRPMENETRKRNYGLQKAREAGYTHFITADVDEFYEPFEVDWNAEGTIALCKTYFKSPTLTIGLDTTLVPFVHKLTPTIKYEFNRKYPFAWDKNSIRIDPTRSFNINSGVVMTNIIMHHYSYCRKNIQTKVFNSTARPNINVKVLMEDLINAKAGAYCYYYQKQLCTAENIFNLPEWPGESLTYSENLSPTGLRRPT